MDGKRCIDLGKVGVLLTLGLLLVFVPEVTAEDEAECYYMIRRISRDHIMVGTLKCDFGCCGTVEDRYCCTEEETYGAQWRAWRIAGITTGSVFFVVVVSISVYCILKKKNRKNMKINNRQAFQDCNGFSTLAPQNLPSAPPSYTYTTSTEPRNWQPSGDNGMKGIATDEPPPRYSTALYD